MEKSNISLLVKKFSRYKVGVIFFFVLAFLYLLVILGGFIAPYKAGVPYSDEASTDPKARELFEYYKKKSAHPPTNIHFGTIDGEFKAYTKEFKMIERPGYTEYEELGVVDSLNELLDKIKVQAIESIINNYPLGEKEGEEYPAHLIELVNSVEEDNLPYLLKVANNTPNQKRILSELLIQTLDEDLIINIVKSVISDNFTYDQFAPMITRPLAGEEFSIVERKGYTKDDLLRFYRGENLEQSIEKDIAYTVVPQKIGMILDALLRRLGVGGSASDIPTERKLVLFRDVLDNIPSEFKEDIQVLTETYKLEGKVGFEGSVIRLEKLLNAYENLDKEYKEADNFEKYLDKYPDIIKEAVVGYLGLEVEDKTVDEYYKSIRGTDYFNSLPSDVQKAYRDAYIKELLKNKEVRNSLYKEVSDKVPEDIAKVIEDSPAYIETTLRGTLRKTPLHVSETIYNNFIDELSNDVLNSQYSNVKDQLPKAIRTVIEDFQDLDLTVRDMFENVIPIDKRQRDIPTDDYTSVNSIDEIRNSVVDEELLQQLPNSVAKVFRDYIDFSGKTVNEILTLIPARSGNPEIPTKKDIIVRRYENLIGSDVNKDVTTVIKKDNPHLIDYLKQFIGKERRYYIHELSFFVKGEKYTLFWAFETDTHLFGTVDKKAFYLMGADKQGRDMFSRILYGGRISLSVGFLGTFLSLIISIALGGVAGYFGGMVDWLVMRICEIVLLFPSLYLLLILRGILPTDMPPAQTFILIVIILSFIQWAGLARIIRGFILAGKNVDYVVAAQVSGIPTSLIIFRHLLPQISSYLIISVSITIPGYILLETNLSFIGFGISEPSVSWGLMLSILREQSILTIVSETPWLLWPAFFVGLVVMCFQLIGDAIRDTLDPMVKR